MKTDTVLVTGNRCNNIDAEIQIQDILNKMMSPSTIHIPYHFNS